MDEKSKTNYPEISQQVIQLIEHSPQAMMISRSDGGLQYVNVAMMHLLGYPPRYTSLADFIWHRQNDLQLSKTLRKKVLEHPDTPAVGTISLQDKAGIRLDLQHSCSALTGSNGQADVYISTLIAQDPQAPQQERLQLSSQVFEASSEGMMVTDENGLIIDVNQAFSQITGYAREQVFGRNASMLSSGQQDKLFYQLMWKRLHSEGQWKGEIWNQRQNGEEFPALFSINAVPDESGQTRKYIALFSDLTQTKAREKQIFEMAYYDSITGLPNRELFNDRMNHLVTLQKTRRRGLALMLLDLDGFKEVNDTLGHDSGDQLLLLAAERLRQCVTKADVVARLGGDEFTVIIHDPATVEQKAGRILRVLSQSFQLGNNRIEISCSIGITRFPEDAEQVSDLLKNADQAMYRVKQQGRNGYRFFDQQMREAALQRLNAIQQLRVAIKQQQFELRYQPIVDLNSGEIHKAEALLRWQHPQLGVVGPDSFIPVAEETGMIIDIGRWVMMEAMQQAYLWRETHRSDFQVSVNVSPMQFRVEGEPGVEWAEQLLHLGLPGQALTVEITENLLMETSDRLDKKMQQFSSNQIEVSLDDFGTGYASLSYLKRFDFQYLKVDKSYVQEMMNDPEIAIMCESIIQMAHKLQIKVVAEGIENRQQLDRLLQMGCDFGQGYLFAKPLSEEEFEPLLSQNLLLDR